MAPNETREAGAERVLTALRARREQLIDVFAHEMVPGFDPTLVGDVREAAERWIDMLFRAISEGRPATREDVLFARTFIRHALLRGASEADLLRAPRKSQRVLWDAVSELAGDTATGRAIVADLMAPLIDSVEVMSEIAAETYAEVQDAMSSTRHHVRRTLLEELLAGRAPASGLAVDALRASGLDHGPPFVVVTAVPVKDVDDDELALTVAATMLSRAAGDPVEPLVAVREHEIVLIRAMRDDAERFVGKLDHARKQVRKDKIPLAIGVSAVHSGLEHVTLAYDEAWQARERVDLGGGLIALPTMSAFDYLLLRGGDRTAWALVPKPIRTFIEVDLAQAGLLVDTLMAYVECDLNARLAAERLFIHHNTMLHRLSKIGDLTGCDLRRHEAVMQLELAIRLARARSDLITPRHRS